MNRRHCLVLLLVLSAAPAAAQSSSGAVTSATGTISPKFSTAYGERFGTKWLSLVRMVKTGAAWQFEESAPVGMLR